MGGGKEISSWAGEELVRNLVAQGRVEEALLIAPEAGLDTTAPPPVFLGLNVAVARGDEAEVDRLIAEAYGYSAAGAGSPLIAAIMAYRAGRYEVALPWIEEWWEQQRKCTNRNQAWMLIYFPKLIGDPRLQALMDEVNVPWRESEVWAEMSD